MYTPSDHKLIVHDIRVWRTSEQRVNFEHQFPRFCGLSGFCGYSSSSPLHYPSFSIHLTLVFCRGSSSSTSTNSSFLLETFLSIAPSAESLRIHCAVFRGSSTRRDANFDCFAKLLGVKLWRRAPPSFREPCFLTTFSFPLSMFFSFILNSLYTLHTNNTLFVFFSSTSFLAKHSSSTTKT